MALAQVMLSCLVGVVALNAGMAGFCREQGRVSRGCPSKRDREHTGEQN